MGRVHVYRTIGRNRASHSDIRVVCSLLWTDAQTRAPIRTREAELSPLPCPPLAQQSESPVSCRDRLEHFVCFAPKLWRDVVLPAQQSPFRPVGNFACDFDGILQVGNRTSRKPGQNVRDRPVAI